MKKLLPLLVVLLLPIFALANGSHPSHRSISKKVDPVQAMLKIAKIIASDPKLLKWPQKPFSQRIRNRIAAVIPTIEWPNTHVKYTGDVNPVFKKIEGEIEVPFLAVFTKDRKTDYHLDAFTAAWGLVLAAWDVELHRPQFVDPYSGIRCDSDKVKLQLGDSYPSDNRPSTIAWGWPWTHSKGKWTLEPTIISPMSGNGPWPTVQDWNDVDRTIKNGPLERVTPGTSG